MPIKPLTQTHSHQLKQLFSHCFFEGENVEISGEDMERFFKGINPKISYGYFDGEKLVGSFIVCNYNIFIRGVLMKMAGVQGVATLPEYRKRGFISELTSEALKTMREEKIVISALYPFKYSFYRKYGYEICCQFKRIETKPNNILLPINFQPLKLREIPFDESLEQVQAIRKKDGQKYTYIILSDNNQWSSHHKQSDKTKIHLILDNDERVTGYFISFLWKKDEQVKLVIDDYNIESEEGFLTILDYIKKHTDQIRDFYLPIHNDDFIFDYFEEVNEYIFTYSNFSGAMFRIVDIEQALALLNFPADLSFSFNLQVEDRIAQWNNEPMTIEIFNGIAKINKNKHLSQIDLKMDILAFNQLFVGYRSISDLYQSKKAAINANMIELIDRAFPKRKTYTSTIF